MGTVTSLTAERMQEIIQEQIVDADIVGGNLILTRADGSTIDAGPTAGAGTIPYALVTKSAVQSIPNGSDTVLSFDTETKDNNAIHDNAVNNSRLTAKSAGLYLVQGLVTWDSNNTGVRDVLIKKNGTQISRVNMMSASGQNSFQNISKMVEMAVDEYVELQVFQNSGSSRSIQSGATQSGFSIAKLGSV